MSLVDKYIFKRILLTSIGTIFIFTSIFALMKFIDEAEKIGRGEYDIFSAFWYTVILTPSLLPLILFVSLLSGVIIAVGKMHENKNFLILQFSSYSPKSIILKISFYVFFIFTVLFVATDFSSKFFTEISNNYRSIKLGETIHKVTSENIWHRQGENFIHIASKIDDLNLKGISYYEIEDMKLKKYSSSPEGKIEGNSIKMLNAETIGINQLSMKSKVAPSFMSEYETDIFFSQKELNVLNKKPHELDLMGLLKRLIFFNRSDIEKKEYSIEFITRILSPINLAAVVGMIVTNFFLKVESFSLGNRILSGVVYGLIIHLIVKIITVYSLTLANHFLLPHYIFSLILVYFSFRYLHKNFPS